MRHGKRRTRLGRQPSHRKATLQNMAKSVLLHERIKTTHVKAKEARRVVEGLISITKEKNSLAARRRAYAILGDRTLVAKLFNEIAPLFSTRNGGYTRIIPYNFRKGDGASMVFLELTERKPEEKPKPIKKAQKATKPITAKEGLAPKQKEVKKTTQPKAAPEVAAKVKEERVVEDVRKEKAKDENKKLQNQKGLMGKFKGFFRRRTNM